MQPRDRKPTGTADIADRTPTQADRRDDDPRYDRDRENLETRDHDGSGSRRNAADAFERPNDGPHGVDRTEARPSATTSPRETASDVRERAEAGTVRSRSFPDAGRGSSDTDRTEKGPLLGDADTGQFRERWEDCQRSFVDEPRESVKAADELVAEVMQKLAGQFAETRSSLERQWDRGDNVSTEDLRIALQRYRDFFHRLLAA
jgi:hypothetical protein